MRAVRFDTGNVSREELSPWIVGDVLSLIPATENSQA
jgi:hypothetical protein